MSIREIEHPANADICFGVEIYEDRDRDALKDRLAHWGWLDWAARDGNEMRIIRVREVYIREARAYDEDDEAVRTDQYIWRARAKGEFKRRANGMMVAPARWGEV